MRLLARIVHGSDCCKANGFSASPPMLLKVHSCKFQYLSAQCIYFLAVTEQQRRQDVADITVQESVYPKESSFSVVFSSESVSMVAKRSKSWPILLKTRNTQKMHIISCFQKKEKILGSFLVQKTQDRSQNNTPHKAIIVFTAFLVLSSFCSLLFYINWVFYPT